MYLQGYIRQGPVRRSAPRSAPYQGRIRPGPALLAFPNAPPRVSSAGAPLRRRPRRHPRRLRRRLHHAPRRSRLRDQPGHVHQGGRHRGQRPHQQRRRGRRLRGHPGPPGWPGPRHDDRRPLRHPDRRHPAGDLHGHRGQRRRQHHRLARHRGERHPAVGARLHAGHRDVHGRCRHPPQHPHQHGRRGDGLHGESGPARGPVARPDDRHRHRHPDRRHTLRAPRRDRHQLGRQHRGRAHPAGERRPPVGTDLRHQSRDLHEEFHHHAQPADPFRRAGHVLVGEPGTSGGSVPEHDAPASSPARRPPSRHGRPTR